MTIVRAHFDGKVFVPDAMPVLQPGDVTLQVLELDMDTHPLSGLPVIRVPVDAKSISTDDVRNALDAGD